MNAKISLLFVLKRSYIFYHIICMTLLLNLEFTKSSKSIIDLKTNISKDPLLAKLKNLLGALTPAPLGFEKLDLETQSST